MRRQIKRMLGIVILLLVVIGVIATVVVAESQRTPDWQAVFAEALPGTAPVFTQRATQPHLFRQEMAVEPVDLSTFPAIPTAPVELYCVVGQRGNHQRLYFVNYHTDGLWNVGWVVWADGDDLAGRVVQETLTILGCTELFEQLSALPEEATRLAVG